MSYSVPSKTSIPMEDIGIDQLNGQNVQEDSHNTQDTCKFLSVMKVKMTS